MSVKLAIPPYLQIFANNMETVEVTGKTVGECLKDLTKQYPEMEKVLFDSDGRLFYSGLSSVAIYVNGEDAYPEELNKKVKDGDEIRVLYMIGGG